MTALSPIPWLNACKVTPTSIFITFTFIPSYSNISIDDFTDSEQYPQDGLLARSNTVTSYGKPEAVFECLDVAAIMSRLQKDLKEEEMLEGEHTDEEGFSERENEMEEEGREKEKMWMRSGEKAVNEDEKPVSTNVSPGNLGPKQSGAEPELEIKRFFDADTHTIVSDKGKGLAVEPSHKPAIIPKFERGTGPAPGEAKYASKKLRSKKNSGFRLFGFGSSSHEAGDNVARSAPGPVQQKLTEDKKQEEKMKAFLKNEYVAKKAALSKARFQLSEATANIRIFEKSIENIEKQMLSKGVQIPSDEEHKR